MGRRKLRVAQAQCQRDVFAELPGVVAIKLGITPATQGNGGVIDFLIVGKSQISIQQIGGAVLSLRIAAGDERWCITASSATRLFIVDVVSVGTTKYYFVVAD